MALVHRQVDRLANRAAAVVDRVGHVGQLHKVLEVVQGGVAAAFVEVAHKGRAVRRREHGVFAADDHVVRRVAGVLREFARCAGLHDGAAHAARKAHALAGDLGTGFAPDVQGLGVVAEIDADFFQDGVGVALDRGQAFFIEHLEVGDLAGDVGRGLDAAGGARGPLGFAASGAAAGARRGVGFWQGQGVAHGVLQYGLCGGVERVSAGHRLRDGHCATPTFI